MKTIDIPLKENSYKIYFGRNLFARIPGLIKKKKLPDNVFIIVDSKVHKLWGEIITKSLSGRFTKFEYIKVNAKETGKSLQTMERIFSKIISKNYSRDTLIISIGGGIIGDIAGFVAATYSRGIKYIQVPTTLLAMVDSAIGGKTGVNFGQTKNIVGSIYQPEFVLIDTDFLRTLPQKEILCGIGEIVKYTFLTNEKFYTYVLKNLDKIFALDKKTIENVLHECVSFKAGVVASDEKEKGLRKVLNLGHTFAHAIEVEQNHKIKHGEAVIIGLACALYLSKEVGLLKKERFTRYSLLVDKFKDQVKIRRFNKHKIFSIMHRDKKNKDNKINFVLLKKAGEIILDFEADRKLIFKSIDYGLNLFS